MEAFANISLYRLETLSMRLVIGLWKGLTEGLSYTGLGMAGWSVIWPPFKYEIFLEV